LAEYDAFGGRPTFVDGRVAMVSVGGEPIGILGEVHPQVLTNFGLTYPVALAELTLQRIF
jgi:phenylalanyl-tRNA synthetase beta chain